MTRALEPGALALLRSAILAGDAAVDVYLDLKTLHVVTIRDGKCHPADLDAAKVEDNDERFAEIPVATTTLEYLWMQDFIGEQTERRVTSCLDGRKGANERFRKRLEKQAPEFVPAWEAFRKERVLELVDDWLDGLGVARG